MNCNLIFNLPEGARLTTTNYVENVVLRAANVNGPLVLVCRVYRIRSHWQRAASVLGACFAGWLSHEGLGIFAVQKVAHGFPALLIEFPVAAALRAIRRLTRGLLFA